MRAKRYLILLITILFCTGCTPIIESNLEQETETATSSSVEDILLPFETRPPEITPAPPEFVADPAALKDTPAAWPDTVYLPLITYNENTKVFEESEAVAHKLVTPTFKYIIYLVEGFNYREKEGGISISATAEMENKVHRSAGFTVYTYGSDKDIEAAFKYHLSNSYAFSHIEESPDDPAFDRIYHSVETGQNTGDRKIWVEFNSGNHDPQREIMIAELYYNKDRPELLQNIYWMIKSFRKY